MYFDEVCNICLKHFSKFSVFSKMNVKNHDFHGDFMVFSMKIGNFYYYNRNQCAKNRKYTQF